MDWGTVVTTVGISGILIGVMGFLARSFIKQVLQIDLENHKHELEIEVERFRSELSRAAFEHQTRFSVLHDKRGVVIAELYNRLSQAQQHAAQAVAIAELEGALSQNERFTNASNSMNSLFDYFETNRIWFSQSVCEKISNYSTELHATLHRFRLEAIKLGGPYENWDAWKDVWVKIHNDMPSLKLEIENEFRGILGISPDKAK
jgi:hypothetical protein